MPELYPWLLPPWQTFLNMKSQQRLPHAILVSGLAGLGKASLADLMVASLLCQSAEDSGAACGHCHSCQLLQAGSHPDHLLIAPEEPGKQIKIDQIRALKNKQDLTPKVSQWKSVLIIPAENMNISASNSLLKLLEEPQPNTALLLVTAKAENLPITIRSRCQKLPVTTPAKASGLAWLAQQSPSTAEGVLGDHLKAAGGAPLAAWESLQQGSDYLLQIKTDFTELLAGKGNPVSMASQWQGHDLLKLFHQLRSWLGERITEVLTQAGGESETQQLRDYWRIDDCIIQAIKLISSQNNFNKALLIEDFMVSIKQSNINPTGR